MNTDKYSAGFPDLYIGRDFSCMTPDVWFIKYNIKKKLKIFSPIISLASTLNQKLNSHLKSHLGKDLIMWLEEFISLRL